MNFFQRKTTWTNTEFIPLKLAIASIYLLIGAYLSEYVMEYKLPLLLLFAATVILAVGMWIRKMQQ